MNKVLLLIMVASTVQVFSMDATSSTADARDRRTGSALGGGGGGGAGTSEPPPEFDGARASLPSLAPGFDKNINEITRFLKMF